MPDDARLSPPLAVLAELCAEEGYAFSVVDTYSQQLVRVSSGAHFFFAGVGRVSNFPLNNAVAASIARDKAFVYQALAHAGIPVPEYGHFFLRAGQKPLRGEGREQADAFAYAARLGYPVFVKPIDGSKGALCDVAYGPDDLRLLLARIGRVHHAALIQRVLTGEDRRLFLMEDRAIFGYRRLPAVLRGDGCSDIRVLLARYNAEMAGAGVSEVGEDSPFLREALRLRGLSLAYVPREGEEIPVSARGNISAGGRLQDYTETVPPDWEAWAVRIMRALGLRVCAIDFFAPGASSPPEALSLIEVNSNPNLEGLIASGRKAKAQAIWRAVARTYFAECRARAG